MLNVLCNDPFKTLYKYIYDEDVFYCWLFAGRYQVKTDCAHIGIMQKIEMGSHSNNKTAVG